MNGALLIASADLMLAFAFVCQKDFEKRFGSTPSIAVSFMLTTGGIKTVFYAILLLVGGTNDTLFSPFSVGLAFLQAALVTSYTLLGFLLLESGGMTLYTLFLMAGGMTLPYLYGVIALNEPLTPFRLAGLACIVSALILYNVCADGKRIKLDRRAQLLCAAFFVLNGFVSIVSKRHQIETTLAVSDTNGFAFWSALIGTLFSTVLHLTLKRKNSTSVSVHHNALWILATGNALAGGLSYLLQLSGAASLPATVLYPAVTGGSILCSALADVIFFKNRPNRLQIAGLALCIVGTCLFL